MTAIVETLPDVGAWRELRPPCDASEWLRVDGKPGPMIPCARPAQWVKRIYCNTCVWGSTVLACDRHRDADDCTCGGTLQILHWEHL